MATAEQHEVVIRWQQQGQAAVQAEANKIKSSFSGIGSSLTKSLSGATSSISKSLGSVAAKAKTAGAAMSLAVTGPLVLMGKEAVSAASDLNESMSAVQTVFGDSAQEVINFSRTAATSLGQSQNASLSMASALGALFQSIGLTSGQMADFTMNLETASADLGSFFNADPSEVLGALKSGLVGEAEPLRRFGILLNEAAVEAEGVKMGLINAGDEMTDQQKVMARYSLIMSQIGAAQGDFARTSDGLANSQRILSSEIQDLQADIGGLLLPAMKDWVNLLKSAVGWVRNLSPEAKDLAVKIGLIAAAAGPVLAFLGTFGPALAALASGPFVLAAGAAVALYKAWESNFIGIRDLVTKVIDRVGEYVGRVVEFFQHAKDRGLDPFSLAFRTMIVTIGEQLGAGNPIVEFLQGIYRNGKKLADWWATDGSTTLQTISGFLSTADFSSAAIYIGHLADDIKSGWDKTIGAWIAEASAFPATLLQGIVTAFGQVNWTLLNDALSTGLKSALVGLDQFSQDIFNTITGMGSAGSPGLGGGGTADLATQLQSWLSEQMAAVKWTDIIASLNAGMAGPNLITDFNQWAQDQGIDLHTQIQTWLEAEIAAIDLTTAQQALSTAGQDLLGQLLQGFGNAMADISTWISGGAGNGGGEAQGLGARISSMISGSFAQAADALIAAGKYPFEQVFQGMQDEWQAILDWAATLNPADLLPHDSSTPDTPPPERHGAGGGSRGTEDPALARAYGGPASGWTWVGERGRELVKLARGSMVIPAGASETRARAMAYGGVADDEPRAYPGGKFFDKGRVWSDVLHRWVSQEHADRAAMRGGPTPRAAGLIRAEDRSRVPRSFYDQVSPEYAAQHGLRSGQVVVYGNVTIHPPNADVAGEISRQFQTRNR